MITTILIGAAVLMLAFIVAISRRPNDFRITRSAAMAAPPAAIFALVNDFSQWVAWWPLEARDLKMKRAYAGPTTGLGAIYAWSGNRKVGAGRLTITESRPGELIRLKLDFAFRSTHKMEIAFKPGPSQTLVIWSVFGPSNFLRKAMDLLMDIDKMAGEELEKGLAQMKAVVETREPAVKAI